MVAVISHHTDETVSNMDRAPALRHYDARAFFRAGQEHTVLRIRRARRGGGGVFFPEPQEIPLLNRLGFGPHPDNVIDIVFRGGRIECVNQRQETKLKALVEAETEIFSGTVSIQRWVLEELLGLRLRAPSLPDCMRWNDKGVFQKTFGPTVWQNGSLQISSGIPGSLVPLGGCVTKDSLIKVFRKLFETDATAFLGKPPDSASGIGHEIIRRGVGNDTAKAIFYKIGTRRVVFQELIKKDIDFSIEINVVEGIAPEDQRPGVVSGQHIVGTSNHKGNFFPITLPSSMLESALRSAEIIMRRLAEEKVWSSGSIDYVGDTRTERVAAVELNLRLVAPDYARIPIRERYGCDLPFDMRSFPVPANLPISEFAEHMDGLLFGQPGERIGFVPFCYLSDVIDEDGFGISYGVCYAPDADQLDALSREVEVRKLGLLGDLL